MNEQAMSKFYMDYNKHRDAVNKCITLLTKREGYNIEYISNMMSRSFSHDKSKEFDVAEFQAYVNMTIELEGLTYGTDEFKAVMNKYDYAIQLHYKNNDHHPEHFTNGFIDMNQYQKDEMVCDWVGSMIARNQLDGFEKSMSFNKDRFNIPDNEWQNIYDTAKYLVENIK